MKNIADLEKNPAFRRQLAQSFIPHSKSLSDAWSKESNKTDKQTQWGEFNANAVFALNKGINPMMTAKGVYLKAAEFRQKIEIALRGNAKYALHRFKDDNFYVHTALYGIGRYGDQFHEGLNTMALLPKDNPNCVVEDCYFFMKGHPKVDQNQNPHMVASSEDDKKHMMAMRTHQHYLDHEGKKIRLASVRYYQWYKPEGHQVSNFYDLVNTYSMDMEIVFDYIQKNNLNMWEDNPKLNDEEFFNKLSELVWIYAQCSPLQDGSAATTEIILKLCLIKRFPDNPPIYFKPGLSIDIRAMLMTQDEFKKVFKSLLRTTPPTQEEIQQGRYVKLSAEMGAFINTTAQMQNAFHQAGKDIDEDQLKIRPFMKFSDDDPLVLIPDHDRSTRQGIEACIRGYEIRYTK